MIATKTEVTDLSEVTIRRISVSEMDNNVYLLTSKDEGTQVLIDAADDARAIAGLVGAGNGDCSQAYGNLQLIITTHSHWDHVRALEEVRSRSEAMTACGADDESDIELIRSEDVQAANPFPLDAQRMGIDRWSDEAGMIAIAASLNPAKVSHKIVAWLMLLAVVVPLVLNLWFELS